MVNQKFHGKAIFTAFLAFILLQLFFSFYSSQTFLSTYGLVHLLSISSFVLFFLLCQKGSEKTILFSIFFYQFILVVGFYYFYTFYYGDPFGAHPTDENWYHSVGLQLQGLNLINSVKHILTVQGLGDLGFPLLLKYVYALGGNEILNMKLVNILFHLLTCVFLYRITRFLDSNEKVARIALILYGLNPITVFFNASGRKEPFFVLVVVASFYAIYKAYISKRKGYYVLGFLMMLTTALFRLPYPVMIALSFVAYFYVSIQGRYKILFRLSLFVITPLALLFILLLLGEELIIMLSIDRTLTAANRIGETPGLFEYIILFISGMIGPIPTFTYGIENENYLLQTVANYIKIFFSFFFLVGCYRLIKTKARRYYPILLFIVGNIVVFTIAAATFDHRFHYPFIPFYFIVIAYGYNFIRKQNFMLTKFSPYLIFILILIIGYNFR